MALPQVEQVLSKDFVTLKIDQDRTIGGRELLERLNPKPGGIPWSVFLDASGRTIITSDDPTRGNVGFPVQDFEIDHFKVMLGKAAKRMTAEDVEALGKSLVAFRDVKLPSR